MTFDVTGKRVTVAGAARSGLAAAELLASRGARVTLSEMRADVPEAGPLRAAPATVTRLFLTSNPNFPAPSEA